MSVIHEDFQEWLAEKGFALCYEDYDTYGYAWFAADEDVAAKVAEEWDEELLERARKIVEEKLARMVMNVEEK